LLQSIRRELAIGLECCGNEQPLDSSYFIAATKWIRFVLLQGEGSQLSFLYNGWFFVFMLDFTQNLFYWGCKGSRLVISFGNLYSPYHIDYT